MGDHNMIERESQRPRTKAEQRELDRRYRKWSKQRAKMEANPGKYILDVQTGRLINQRTWLDQLMTGGSPFAKMGW